MGALPATNRVSVEEYLSNPAYRRCEYVDGTPVERSMVGIPHSRVQAKIARKLDEYLDSHPGSFVGVELHCRLKVRGETQFRLPDVALVQGLQPAEQRYLDRAPDLVVEIRSPDDSFSGLMRKMDEYFANGSKIGWVVLPEEKSVIELSTGNQPRSVTGEESLDGGELFPGLEIPLAELFV
jgi:Uma2 family endonuclease